MKTTTDPRYGFEAEMVMAKPLLRWRYDRATRSWLVRPKGEPRDWFGECRISEEAARIKDERWLASLAGAVL